MLTYSVRQTEGKKEYCKRNKHFLYFYFNTRQSYLCLKTITALSEYNTSTKPHFKNESNLSCKQLQSCRIDVLLLLFNLKIRLIPRMSLFLKMINNYTTINTTAIKKVEKPFFLRL